MSATLSEPQRTAATDLAARCAIAATIYDTLRLRHMMGGEPQRLAAIVENIVAAIQGRVEPSEWPAAGDATAEAIERRCADGSAVATALLRLRPSIAEMGRGFRPELLGTDAVGRGAGWAKTANAVEIAKGCNDELNEHEIESGAVFRALKDLVVAAVHALGPMERGPAGVAIGRLVRRRMVV